MASFDPDVFGASDRKAPDAEVFRPTRRPAELAKPEPVTDFSGNLRLATPFGTLDSGIPLPEGVNRRLAQYGSGVADWLLGARQIAGGDTPELRQQADTKRKLDEQLNNDAFGKVLSFAGKASPAMAIPQIAGAPIVSGALAGLSSGFVEPVGEGDSRLSNTVFGGTLGAAVPGVFGLARRAARPDQATADLARRAGQYGIPVAPADMAANPLVRAVRSVTNDIPVVGVPGAVHRNAQQEALNRAVGNEFGAPAAKLTPDVVDAARRRMGAEFDRIWNNNSLVVDVPMLQRFQALRSSAQDLPAEEARRTLAALDDFMSKVNPGPNQAPMVPGDTANKFQQWLREKAGGNSLFAKDAAEMRKTILETFNRSNPNDAAALTLNRSQYKAFKTVEPLLDKSAAAVAGRVEGDVPASLLPGAVAKSYPGLSSQTNQPGLADLSRIASRFMVDRSAQTGGSPRAIVQNTGLTLGGIGGIFADPFLGGLVASGSLATNAALNSGLAGRALINPTQRSLLGAPSLPAASREALRLSLERSPIGLLGILPVPELAAAE